MLQANEESFVAVQHHAIYMQTCVLCIVAGDMNLS